MYYATLGLQRWRGDRVDSAFDLCLKHTSSYTPEAGYGVTTVGKLFTPTVPSGTEGWLNQMTPNIAGTSVATLGKSFTCIGPKRTNAQMDMPK